MNRTRRHRSLQVIIATSLLLRPSIVAGQEKLADDALRRRGVRAYDQLPRVVGLEHAPLYTDAVRFLFAYEQRSYRRNQQPGNDVMTAMDWLSHSLTDFEIGKGDVMYPRLRGDDQLRSKGLAAYTEARKSVEGGRIWDVEAFIRASANLYAYLQVAPSPRKDARSAFDWLQRNRDRLAKAGGKADAILPWAPSTPKPGSEIQASTLAGIYTIRQVSSGRYVDAHQASNQDFALVTRPAQSNYTQRWMFTPLGNNRYTIQQASNARYVDAHQSSNNDFRLVTRTVQDNDTQRWIVTPLGNDRYTIQQASNGRFVDAHQSSSNDFRLVTRPAQNNDTQRWTITRQ